jgi:hypothetical protein
MAYLDPGTGSLLIQLLIGGALGIALAVRIFWKNITGIFNKNKPADDELEDPTAIIDETDEV